MASAKNNTKTNNTKPATNEDDVPSYSTDDWEEFVPTLGLRAQGFWNAREEYIGEVMEGILLDEQRFDGKGDKLDNPFYFFRLLKPLNCWIVPSREEREAGEEAHAGELPAGSVIGVSHAASLNGIMKKRGHGFKIRYDGKKAIGGGKTLHQFKFKTSPKPLIQVEKNDPGKPTDLKSDKDADAEIPF